MLQPKNKLMNELQVQYLFFLFTLLLFFKLLVLMFQTENPLPVIKNKSMSRWSGLSLECQKQFMICTSFCLTLPRHAIGLKNSRHFVIQSEVKTNNQS